MANKIDIQASLRNTKTSIISGHLQIDHERGVIYFHACKDAIEHGVCPTPLRICRLGKIRFPLDDRQIDITLDENTRMTK